MLKRLLEQTPAIVATVTDEGLTKSSAQLKHLAFSFDEHTLVQGVTSLLGDYQTATTLLCANKTPTMQKVLLILKTLASKTEPQEDNPPPIVHMITVLKCEMDNRVSAGDKDLMLLASGYYSGPIHKAACFHDRG